MSNSTVSASCCGIPVKKLVMLFVAIAAFLFFWLVPRTFYGLGVDGSPLLSIVEQRTVAIFVLAALLWMFEIIPAWTTSVLIIEIGRASCRERV